MAEWIVTKIERKFNTNNMLKSLLFFLLSNSVSDSLKINSYETAPFLGAFPEKHSRTQKIKNQYLHMCFVNMH